MCVRFERGEISRPEKEHGDVRLARSEQAIRMIASLCLLQERRVMVQTEDGFLATVVAVHEVYPLAPTLAATRAA